MICKSFEELTIKEKIQMIGKINHLIQSHEIYFGLAEEIIARAERHGLFKDVIISPSNNMDEENR